jgi:4-hydroxybenzoate polyprenyltransferase
LAVLVQFNWLTIVLGVSSLVLVAIYPFMKRITWWPQLFLGLAFSWGALVGWTSEVGSLSLPPVLLYLGTILWTIGYDTIYALQDVEDDALIGVRSTARLFGARTPLMVALFYAATLLVWGAAAILSGGSLLLPLLMAPAAALLVWQVVTIVPKDPHSSLVRFRANHWVGLLFTLAMLADMLI